MITPKASAPTIPTRESIRARHLMPEPALVAELIDIAKLDEPARVRIRQRALELASEARRRSSEDGFALALVHRFGLDTPHGVALMQLAEALPRTIAPVSAHALIADKIGTLSWRDAVGRTSSFAERMALHGLDTLSKAFREPKVDSKMQRLAYKLLRRAITVLGGQYVLGETLSGAYRNGAKFAREGFAFSYDMLGEAAMTDASAQNFHRSYLDAIDFLATRDVERYAVSVKLSALHPRFEERQRETALPALLQRVLDIAIRARDAKLQLTIDAEESDRLEITLDVVEYLLQAPQLAGWNGLGLAVQAYQRRAIGVVDYLARLAKGSAKRLNIRLVKGAYWDTEIKRAQQLGLVDYPIFVRKYDTDASYIACARKLLEYRDELFPQFATHNAHTCAAICELAKQTGNDRFEFQRLHGMGEHVHTALMQSGFKSRIYAPIGPRRDLLPYLVRRLLENGASSSFVRQLTDESIPIEQLARDPLTVAVSHAHLAPGVAPPNFIRNQSWPSARGIDITNRPVAEQLLHLLNADFLPLIACPLVNGEALEGTPHAISNPARTDRQVGTVVNATPAQTKRAIEVADNAFKSWSQTPPARRAAILERAAALLEERAPEFIRLAVLEAGKTLDDAISEVREAVDFCRYYGARSQHESFLLRRPLGAVACISPWNFPLAIFLGQVTGALAAGNTVVAKPAEQTPLIAMLATRLLHEAGVPPDALNLVTGDGDVGAALVSHRDIRGVVFTGSVATAKAIAKSLADTGRADLPFIAETGGINAMIVDCSALPEQVVRDALSSAFQSAGQRCSALRILCLQEEIADSTLAILKGALAELRVGDPCKLDTDIGPVIDSEAQKNILTYIEFNSKLIRAQATLDPSSKASGTFVAPTLLEVNRVEDVKQEVFGPVLHLIRYAATDLLSLVNSINRMGYGLTLCVHTRIKRRAQAIIDNARVGNIYVNRNQVGAVVGQQPFGGCGLSGTGPKAGGPHYLLGLSEPSSELPRAAHKLQFIEAQLSDRICAALTQARQAQVAWGRLQRRIERVQFACELLSANTSHILNAAARAVRLPNQAELSAALAHVAGEENSLQLLPRGVLLCLDLASDDLNALASQILMAVATGNGVLAVVGGAQVQALRELIAELQQMGVQKDLIVGVEVVDRQVPTSWLTQLEIDGVVFDGDAECRQRMAALLARRDGALLPLLSSRDDIDRFGVEQTVTINTAAAGGDPRLLALTN